MGQQKIEKQKPFLNRLHKPAIGDKTFLTTITGSTELNGGLLAMKNTILNLVYPAILGSILYGIIAYTPDPIIDWKDYPVFWYGPVENRIRLFALFGLVLFFFCDYLHLYVVRTYSLGHFLIHFITSLLLLKATLFFLPTDAGKKSDDIEDISEWVSITVLIISAMYLVYDFVQVVCKKGKMHAIEMPLYKIYFFVNVGLFLLSGAVFLFVDAGVSMLKIQMLILISVTAVYFYLLTRKNKIEGAKLRRRMYNTVAEVLEKDKLMQHATGNEPEQPDTGKRGVAEVSATLTTAIENTPATDIASASLQLQEPSGDPTDDTLTKQTSEKKAEDGGSSASEQQ